MRKLLFTFVGIVTVEFLVAPLGGRVFDHFFPEERGFAGMMPDVPFYQWGYASILALGLVVGVGITRWQDKRTKSRAGGGPIASATPTDKPIGSPSPSRLPTAAELLQEQELCETMRAIQEFIEGSGNEARSDLGGIIIEVVRLYSYQQSKICKALKFFVQDAINLGYTENMKEIIADIRQSLGDRSIDRVQQNLASFMREYRRGQQCLGVLISATSVHLTSVQGYDRWLKSDEQCVREFHDLASRPLLRASKEIKGLCTVILEASEQDFGNVDLEKALDGQFEAPLSPATRGR